MMLGFALQATGVNGISNYFITIARKTVDLLNLNANPS
jgi:hypothetical protein